MILQVYLEALIAKYAFLVSKYRVGKFWVERGDGLGLPFDGRYQGNGDGIVGICRP